jgi:hypothetical protein
MKKTIKNLAQKLTLGIALTAGTLGFLPTNYSNQAQAQARDPTAGILESELIEAELVGSRFYNARLVKGNFKLHNYEFGKLSQLESYLFIEKYPSRELDKPSIIFGDGAILLRGTPTQESHDFTFQKDGAKIIAQALKGGELLIDFRFNESRVIGKGNFYIVNGQILTHNERIGSLNEKGQKIFTPTKKSIPLRLLRFSEDGEEKLGEIIYDSHGNHRAEFPNQTQTQPLRKQGDGYLLDNRFIPYESREPKPETRTPNTKETFTLEGKLYRFDKTGKMHEVK